MHESAVRPTLLVFTLGPRGEGSRRRLLPRPLRRAEIQLHDQGLRSVLEAGRQAGLRIVVASPEPLELPQEIEQIRQRGRSFADRLRGAMRAVRAGRPEQPLLVVGTDTLDLHRGHLLAALRRLEVSTGDVVLGPAFDGGLYLLGTRADLDEELASVSWCRSYTLRQLVAAIRGGGRNVHLLEPLQDLDHLGGVETWLTLRATSKSLARLKRWLQTLLSAWRRPATDRSTGLLCPALVGSAHGRAPPR